MAQPDRSGLSNPYAPLPAAVPARSRTGLARAAVLAGVGGAATLGLAGPAAAAPSVAAPVSPYDDGVACYRMDQPVTHGGTPRAGEPVPQRARFLPRDPVMHGAGDGVLSRRCGVPPAWWRLPAYPPPAPEPEEPIVAPGDPVDGAQLVSVDGTVEAGVEPGCTVLRGVDGAQWTLVGPLATLPSGVPLTVDGVTAPDVLSTCQQGEVLRVRQVALLEDEPGPTVPIATTHRLVAGARPIPLPRVYPAVDPACGPTGKIPTTTLCTR